MAGTAGRSGRRPKPTARKALAGNPGKRALNKDEPVFTPIKGVEPPEWFAEEDLPLATIMWQLTTKELCGQGLLCVTDLAVLERWCVAYEFWRRAVKNIARQGNTITGAMGGMVKKQRATGERLHKLISTHPNSYMTPQEFWELVVTCLCLRGNFYAYKVKAFGEVAELLPVDPGCVVSGGRLSRLVSVICVMPVGW